MVVFDPDRGVRFCDTDLWFDAKKKVGLNFISNASTNPLTTHERIIATPETLAFIEKRIKGSSVLSCPYNRPFSVGNLKVELIPSGFMLGGAQIVVETEGIRMTYAGDINLRYSKSCNYIQIRRSEYLILKCRYGIPKYLFPPDEEVLGSIYEFIKESLFFGYTPLIIAEPYGKTQDLLLYLQEKKLSMSVHRSIWNVLKVYEKFGCNFPNCELLNLKRLESKVIVLPPYIKGSRLLELVTKKRVAAVVGWSIDIENEIKEMFGADFVFPLSPHAGYDELMQYVHIVNPQKVFLLGTYSMEFSNALKKQGFDATPLDTPIQLKFF